MTRGQGVGMGKGFWIAVVVLLVALMGSIGVVGFLLGKQTQKEAGAPAHGPVMTSSGETAAPAPSAAPETPESPASGVAAEAPQASLRIVQGPEGILITDGRREGHIIKKDGHILLSLHQEKGAPPDSPAPPVPPPPPAPAPATAKTAKKSGLSEAEQVRQYFLQLATLQRGPVGVGPQQFAERLTGNLAQGNSADFDELVADAEKALFEVRKLVPPPPCQEIHQKTVEAMAESLEILKGLREAMEKRNVSELQALEGRARVMMKRVQDLDRQQAALREKFGAF